MQNAQRDKLSVLHNAPYTTRSTQQPLYRARATQRLRGSKRSSRCFAGFVPPTGAPCAAQQTSGGHFWRVKAILLELLRCADCQVHNSDLQPRPDGWLHIIIWGCCPCQCRGRAQRFTTRERIRGNSGSDYVSGRFQVQVRTLSTYCCTAYLLAYYCCAIDTTLLRL